MKRRVMRVHFVSARTEGDEVVSLRVAHGRMGKVIGDVPLTEDVEDLEKLACVYQSTPLYIVAGTDKHGKLVDPVFLGFGKEALEKAAAAEDPLTAATVNWQKSEHSKKQLAPVLSELRKVVAGRAQDFSSRGGAEIPQAEFMKAGLKALRKYDPKRGARASTYVVSSLKGAHRPLLKRATPIRVPETRLQQVGKVRRARAELEDKGMTPTFADVARQAKMRQQDVRLVEKEVQPIHVYSKEQVARGDKGSQLKEVWALLGPELKGNERKVYDYLNRRPEAKNDEISKRLGVSPSQVSRYRQNLRRRVLAHAKRK